MPSSVSFSTLISGEWSDLLLVVRAASLSAVVTFLFVVHVAMIWCRRHRAYRMAHMQMFNTKRQMVILQNTSKRVYDASDSPFFTYLMVAGLMQATSGLVNIRWATDTGVDELSSLCTLQGIVRQHSELGIALMSLFLAAKSFCVLVLGWIPSTSTTQCAVGFVYLFIALMQAVAVAVRDYAKGSPYYGDAGSSSGCWIGEEYGMERVLFGYLWLWLAAFVILVLYGITALVSYCILNVGLEDNGRRKFDWSWSRRASRSTYTLAYYNNDGEPQEEEDEEAEEKQGAAAIADLTFFYPAVYLICICPLILLRCIEYSGHYVPTEANTLANVLFSLIGLFNTIVYVIKHPRFACRGRHTINATQEYHEVGHMDHDHEEEKYSGMIINDPTTYALCTSIYNDVDNNMCPFGPIVEFESATDKIDNTFARKD